MPPSPSTAAGAVPIEVTVTCVTFREVSYMVLDKTFSGCLSQLVFLQDLQPVTELGDSTSLMHSYF